MKRYRMQQIKLHYTEDKNQIEKKLREKLGKKAKGAKIEDLELIRESIDARKKPDVFKVYTVDFDCDRELNLDLAPDMAYKEVPSGISKLVNRPVVVGFGPCGMFAAYILAKRGYKPIVLERGDSIDERVEKVKLFWKNGILDTECNVQFGEGGAGTFSDGKLTSGIKDYRVRFVLETFVEMGADPAILYEQKPHIGTDVLRIVVKNLRCKIVEFGGEVRFRSKLVSADFEAGRLKSIKVESGPEHKVENIETENLVLAIGHSARDTIRELNRIGIEMQQKPFSIGVRIEHPQEIIDISQYGKEAALSKKLPPAAYKLNYHCENGRGVYTFCMCPGGEVIKAASCTGMTVVNGMSNHDRDSGTANSGLLVDVRTSDFAEPDNPLSGIDFQEKYERLAYENSGASYEPPTTTWKELKDKTANSMPVINSLPEFATDSIIEAMPHLGRKLKGFDSDDAVIKAVETRSSSPVRITRDKESLSSEIEGLYPGGEGAGYAGGITSAACDGIKIAEKIIEKYAKYE